MKKWNNHLILWICMIIDVKNKPVMLKALDYQWQVIAVLATCALRIRSDLRNQGISLASNVAQCPCN